MKHDLSSPLRALGGVAGLFFVVGAVAQTPAPATYAVVSMIGDDLSIVTHEPTVGSHLDSNDIQHLPLDGAQFDRVATQGAIVALKRSVPGATTRSLTTAVRPGPESDDELPESAAGLRVLLDDVAPQLKDADVRYLLAVSKHRGDARVRLAHGTMGSGKLRGIGFYLDQNYRVRSSVTGSVARGFIAPFVYLNVTLIDVATGAIVHSESTSEATAVATARSDSALVPWEALTADEKINFLTRMIRRAMATTVPHVVAPT